MNNYDNEYPNGWWDRTKGSLDKYRGMGIRGLLNNFASLSVLQAANYLLPLIILPYLVRVIGVEKFGLIVFAQAITQYFIIVTDYGFNLSATKDISVHRNDAPRVSAIFSSVYIIKGILTILCFGILLLMVTVFDKFSRDAAVYILTYGIVIGGLLFPVWYFQGVERMKHITVLTILGRLIYIALLFIFVREQSDYILVPLFNSIGAIAGGILSTAVALSKFKVRLYFPPLSTIMGQFKASSQFFLSRISISIYSSFNTVILGFYTSNEMVGYYAAAEKIYIAMRNAFSPLVQALYPYMASRANVRMFKKVFAVSVAAAAALSIAVFLLSDTIVPLLFGESFGLSSRVLKLFTLVFPFEMASILLGYPFLAALGKENYANFSIAIGSVVHLCVIVLLIPQISPTLVALAIIFTQLVVLYIRIHGIRKHRLWQLS